MTDIQVKIASLSEMARMNAQQGDIQEALSLHEQSLELSQKIGDVGTQAATLYQMARLIGQQGDVQRASELCQQSIQALIAIEAYPDLVTVIGTLAKLDSTKSEVYLAQAIWLSLTIQFPLEGLITLLAAFSRLLSAEDNLLPLIGTTIMYLSSECEEDDPQLEEYQELAMSILEIGAATQGIKDKEGFKDWFAQQGLNDPNFFFPELIQNLEARVGDNWLFERNN
jgi:tetratricopeptide (TPR) repeat protein